MPTTPAENEINYLEPVHRRAMARLALLGWMFQPNGKSLCSMHVPMSWSAGTVTVHEYYDEWLNDLIVQIVSSHYKVTLEEFVEGKHAERS